MLTAAELLKGPKIPARRIFKGEVEITDYLDKMEPGEWVSLNILRLKFGGRPSTAREILDGRDDFEAGVWSQARRAYGWRKV